MSDAGKPMLYRSSEETCKCSGREHSNVDVVECKRALKDAKLVGDIYKFIILFNQVVGKESTTEVGAILNCRHFRCLSEQSISIFLR